MNAIRTIRPYRANSTWVFDDPAVGLQREPFVAGVPAIIDELVGGIPGAERGFRMLFSAGPFPGATPFELVREEAGGNWYRAPDSGAEGWLCPALFKYFPEPPPRLFVKAEPLAAGADEEPAITVPLSDVRALRARLAAGDVAGAAAMIDSVLGTR